MIYFGGIEIHLLCCCCWKKTFISEKFTYTHLLLLRMKRVHEDCYVPEKNSVKDEEEEQEESCIPGMPQKKFFRSRAHCNPVSCCCCCCCCH